MHFILGIVLSLIPHIYIAGVQVRMFGHTGEGNCICTRDEDGFLEIDDECPVTGHSGSVNSVAYSPDGKHIVSGSGHSAVKVWDAATGTEVSHRVLTLFIILLLCALMLTCVFGP